MNELDLALLQIQQLRYDLKVSADGVLSMPSDGRTRVKKFDNFTKNELLETTYKITYICSLLILFSLPWVFLTHF